MLPKVLIVLLVILVVLFFVGIGCGLTGSNRSTNGADFNASSPQTLTSLFIKKQPLKAAEVSPSCFSPGPCVIPQGMTVQFDVQPSNNSLRQAKLSVIQGPSTGIDAAFPQSVEQGRAFARRSIANGATDTLDVDGKAGKMTITCHGSLGANPPCRVTLAQ
jgi:hypothetical protein